VEEGVTAAPDPVRISVRVTPRGGRDAIDGWTDEGVLRVRVAAAPADGKANEAVVRTIAKAAGVAPSSVSIISGSSSRTKIVEVGGVTPEQLGARLGRVIA
jgi:uncharacterized protein (TIGR00251 family)